MHNAIEEHRMSRPSCRKRWRWNVGRAGAIELGVAVLMTLGGTACSLDGLLNSDDLPSDVSDPALTETPDGARRAYHGVLAQFRDMFGVGSYNYILSQALLSDEVVHPDPGNSPIGIDQRFLPEGASGANLRYEYLQKTRAQAGQAIALLADYLADQPALRGRLYALKGYTEIFLAELFCSGVPLSTLDYGGDYTYRPGSTTEQVLEHAVALFDTAVALAEDSARFLHVAQVGRGRALLGLGEYAAAAVAAAAVAEGYRYNVDYGVNARSFFNVGDDIWDWSIPDREGVNGMNWITSDDPRTETVSQTSGGNERFFPAKYATDGSSPIVLASAVEARLIEAEASLQAGSGAWLTTLNALRTDGTFEIVDSQAVTDTTVDNTVSPPDTTIDTTAWTYDTLWHAGSGGVDGLGPLDDPGTAEGRVDLVFRERAFWLFLTGHRQGDLRRLIRQYGRNEFEIYPVGAYADKPFPYGSDVTLPIPEEEYVNPLFTGCASRGA